MTIRPALILLVATTVLTGCWERENPLLQSDVDQLAEWLVERANPPMLGCANLWAHHTGKSLPADKQSICEPVAADLAKDMTAAGYGDVKPEDVPVPTIWLAFETKAKKPKIGNDFNADTVNSIFD